MCIAALSGQAHVGWCRRGWSHGAHFGGGRCCRMARDVCMDGWVVHGGKKHTPHGDGTRLRMAATAVKLQHRPQGVRSGRRGPALLPTNPLACGLYHEDSSRRRDVLWLMRWATGRGHACAPPTVCMPCGPVARALWWSYPR